MDILKILKTPGVHENTVRALFHGHQIHFDGDVPEFENPLVLLGFMNRSGSNLLGIYLRDVPGFSGFSEDLNSVTIQNQCKLKNLNAFPTISAALRMGAPGATVTVSRPHGIRC